MVIGRVVSSNGYFGFAIWDCGLKVSGRRQNGRVGEKVRGRRKMEKG
ncbi:MAG: hypothetical protein ACE5GL_01665 [Calditrichia bacterium]